MDLLGLVNRTREKCGITGNALDTVQDVTGESLRVLNWVNEAWMELQTRRQDWMWMRNDFSFATVAGQGTYTAVQCGISDWGNWALDNFRNYPTASGNTGEILMDYWSYQAWRDTFQFSGNRDVQTRPYVAAITPDKQLALGPFPAAGYTITGSYYRVATEMAANDDVPTGLPTQFHMAVVYRAMMFYGAYESAQEVYVEGQNSYDRMMARIERHQLPTPSWGGSLA
jgi:hypothetical protein